MIYILIAVLVIDIAIIYNINGKDVASPSIIAFAVFSISSFIYALNMRSYFGNDISLETVIVSSTLLWFVFFGELLSKRFVFTIGRKQKSILRSNNDPVEPISVSKTAILLFSAISLSAGLLYFFDVYKFSLLVGNSSGNFLTMAEYVRQSQNFGSGRLVYSSSTLISQLNIISECIVYIFIYIYSHNRFLCKYKDNMLLLPCVGYIIYIVSCDSRSNIIRNIAIIFIIVYHVVKQKGLSNRSFNKKIIRFGILAVILFAIIFRVLGYRTGTSNNYSFAINITKYASSGIFGLNEFISKPSYDSHLFGAGVFRLIYIKLNDFGFSFDMGGSNDVFYQYLNGQANIYTGLKVLLKDFHFIGAAFFLAIWGAWIQQLRSRVDRNGISIRLLVGIGLLYFPIVMISIGGEWGNVLSITSIYTLFYIIILERILIQKS